MNATKFTNGFSEKIIVLGERAILGLKLARPHNFGSALKIFCKFSTMKGTKRYMEIILMVFLKKKIVICGKGTILGLKMSRAHNFRSALRIFLKFCTMEGVMQSEQSKRGL